MVSGRESVLGITFCVLRLCKEAEGEQLAGVACFIAPYHWRTIVKKSEMSTALYLTLRKVKSQETLSTLVDLEGLLVIPMPSF
jgi:hypothetical protein